MNQFMLVFLTPLLVLADHWPQASGPNGDWQVTGVEQPPVKWSVARNENVRWRTVLPEGGQSAVTIWGNQAFVTTYQPISESADLKNQSDIVGYCLDADNGEILWQVQLPGSDPVGAAGAFSDATVFAPICDGEKVWFFNRCGSIGCFDLQGNQQWLREYQPRRRHTNRQCEPFLIGDKIITVEVKDKAAGQKLERHKPVPDGIVAKDVWTYLHAIDKNTGKVLWVGDAGTVVHNTPMPAKLKDGRWAIVHGRGGGHGPLETPYGASLTLADTGKSLWSRKFRGWCSHNSHWDEKGVYWFAGNEHHVLDPLTGKTLRRANVGDQIEVISNGIKETKDIDFGSKIMTYHTNIVVGDWHYFLAHKHPYLVRVNIQTGDSQALKLPYQLMSDSESRKNDVLVWSEKELKLNSTKNSRGIDIATDKRAKKSGWGHMSAASPILVNDHLYFPMMNGTVYVIDTTTETLNEEALVAVNDLGPAYDTWTLASFSYAQGRLYMHTMKEVVCIETNR